MPDDVPGDLSAVDGAQLEVWAFGRQGSVADRERAEAALLELARRAAAQRTSSTARASTGSEIDSASEDSGVAHELEATPEPLRRRRLTRLAVALAVGILSIAGVATVLLATMPRESSSLDIFDRSETEAEAEIRRQLQRVGQRVNVGPRVLTRDDLTTVVAYKSSNGEGGAVDRVCLALIEAAGVGDWRCVQESAFVDEGAEFELYGIAGVSTIVWGPNGEPLVLLPDTVDVGPAGGTGEIGDYRDALLREQSADDRAVGVAIGAAGITPAHGPIIVSSVAQISTVATDDRGVIAAWSAVAPDPQVGVEVCLGIVDLAPADDNGDRPSPGTIREAMCVDDDRMTGEGLRFEVATSTGTAVFLWSNALGLRASVVEN